MKPYPFAALNHFTVPFSFICVSFFYVCECFVLRSSERRAYRSLQSKRGSRLACTWQPPLIFETEHNKSNAPRLYQRWGGRFRLPLGLARTGENASRLRALSERLI